MPEAQFKKLLETRLKKRARFLWVSKKTTEKQGKLFDAQEAYTQDTKENLLKNNLSQIFR